MNREYNLTLRKFDDKMIKFDVSRKTEDVRSTPLLGILEGRFVVNTEKRAPNWDVRNWRPVSSWNFIFYPNRNTTELPQFQFEISWNQPILDQNLLHAIENELTWKITQTAETS